MMISAPARYSRSSSAMAVNLGLSRRNSLLMPWTLSASSCESRSGFRYQCLLLPVSLRATSSTQPISMMRSPPSADKPVVSVSRTIWRIGRIMLERMFDLTGKIALVTGGNGGIGLGMARGLGEAGATVLIVGRNAEKSSVALRDLQSRGVRAETFSADL